MTPSTLKQYLQTHKQASLRDITIHFDTDADVVKSAIELWIHKGKIQQSTQNSCNKGCCQCDPELSTIYYWKED